MDTLFGIAFILLVGYIVYRWVIKEDIAAVAETKIEPAKKIDSDFVTGLPGAVAKVEAAIVEEVKEVVKVVEAKVEEEVKVEVAKVVEEIKVETVKLEEKTKAIEAAVEAKAEKLVKAVKKTKAKAKK